MHYPVAHGLVQFLVAEVETLRVLGVRRTAALHLVAERHSLPTEHLDEAHFNWTLQDAGLDLAALNRAGKLHDPGARGYTAA